MSIKAKETVIFHYESVINGRIQIRLTSGYLIKCQPKQMSGYLITLCKIPTKIVISMFWERKHNLSYLYWEGMVCFNMHKR